MSLTTSKKDAKTTLEEISKINLDECAVSVYLASVDKDAELPEFQKLQLTDDLTAEFRSIGSRYCGRLNEDLESGDLVVQKYDPSASLESHELEVFELLPDSSVTQQIKSLSSLASIPLFKADADFVKGLRFYVIVAQPKQGKPVFFFRSYTPKKELARSTFFGAILEKGQFDTVKQPLFLFDYIVDCFSRDDQMFILSKDKFQKIFQFFEKLLASGTATLKTIKSQIPIANFEAFETSCQSHVQKLAKLMSISQKPYFKTLSMKEMKRVIKGFKLNIKTAKINGQESLVFDSADKWAILHLLDDYYLNSSMTGIKYGANSKRMLQQ
jgi:hypothetical protein